MHGVAPAVYTDDFKRKVVALYRDHGLTLTDIHARYGLGSPIVLGWLNEAGVAPRPRGTRTL